MRGVRASTRGEQVSKRDVTLVANDNNFLSHDYPPARDCLRVASLPRELSICLAGFRGGSTKRKRKRERERKRRTARQREYVGLRVNAIASTTDSVDARRPRRRYYAKRERKANWTERRSLRSFGSCVFALMPFSPATRTATTTTPTPTPTPLVATMARRRNRRPKRPHLARFSTNIPPPPPNLFSPTVLSYSHPSLARSFFPTFSPLPVHPAVLLSPTATSPPSRPARPVRASCSRSPHYSIDPTGKALCRVPFASAEPRLRIQRSRYARCAVPERSLKRVDLSTTDLPSSSPFPGGRTNVSRRSAAEF